MVNKIINAILPVILASSPLFIWEVDQDELAYFKTSLLPFNGHGHSTRCPMV